MQRWQACFGVTLFLTVGLYKGLAVLKEPLTVFAKQVCSPGAYGKHCLRFWKSFSTVTILRCGEARSEAEEEADREAIKEADRDSCRRSCRRS